MKRIAIPEKAKGLARSGLHVVLEAQNCGIATTAAKNGRRLGVSLHSSFFHPGFGMDAPAPLARSSATVIRFSSGSDRDGHTPFGMKLFALSCLHNVHPFRYGNQFPEWVSQMSSEHIVGCRVEVNDVEGMALAEMELDVKSLRAHPVRDFVALEFEDVDSSLKQLQGCGVEVFDLDLLKDPSKDEELTFFGHTVTPKLENERDVSSLHPFQTRGSVCFSGEVQQACQDGIPARIHQVFATTETTLSMGMCGGPAVDSTGHCVGMIEGILSEQAVQSMGIESQLAAIFSGQQIVHFLLSSQSTSN